MFRHSLSASLIRIAAVACFGSGTVLAQSVFPLEPLVDVADAFITDSTLDKLYRLKDLDLNGDFNGVGEVALFYDDLVGSVNLGNNSSLTLGVLGDLFVADRGEGRVFHFFDADGDGLAHGPGEAVVYFDGDPLVNAGGLDVAAPVKVTVDQSGVLWIAEADQGGVGKDSILRLEDLNGDGDANDLGEALRYFEPNMGTVPTDTQIIDVFIGIDSHVCYVEGSTTGFRAPGIYRLDDADANGLINPLTEDAPMFLVPVSPSTILLQSGTQDGAGNMYLSDTGNGVIWRARDDDSNGSVDPVTEATIFLTALSGALIWDVSATFDGRVLCSGVSTGAQVILLEDLDASGVIDVAGELLVPYLSSLSPVPLTNPRGLVWIPRPRLNVPTSIGIGTLGIGSLAATKLDSAWVYFSLGTVAPMPLAPYGFVEIDPSPVSFFTFLASGTLPFGGPMTFSIPVPNSPGLVGLTVYFQALSGKADRFLLSNLDSLMVL